MSITLDGVSSLPSAAATATATTGSATADQETFLKLLVTQLQNQDPLNPQSNEEFVAQLAQFSSLEQLVTLNGGVESLTLATSSMNNAAMTDLIGKDVVAWSSEFSYPGSGDVALHFDAESATSQTTITITDEDGDVVWSGEIGALEEGEGSWTWDGKDSDGNTAPEGTYTFDIDATNTSGEEVAVDGQIHGTIDEMSYETGSPTPSIGGVEITLGDVLRVETQK